MTIDAKKQMIEELFGSIEPTEFITVLKDQDGKVMIGETASKLLVYMNCSYVRLGGQPLDLTLEFRKHD